MQSYSGEGMQSGNLPYRSEGIRCKPYTWQFVWKLVYILLTFTLTVQGSSPVFLSRWNEMRLWPQSGD